MTRGNKEDFRLTSDLDIFSGYAVCRTGRKLGIPKRRRHGDRKGLEIISKGKEQRGYKYTELYHCLHFEDLPEYRLR